MAPTTDHQSPTRSRRRARLLAAAAAAAVLALPAAGAGADTGAVQVRGVQAPATGAECAGGYVMTGTLTGCWYVDTAQIVRGSFTSSGFLATGTEHFDGCIFDDSHCGTFHTTFSFTAKFDADGNEIHGRCHHPVVGGDGVFAGATGQIEMHDEPTGCAVYNGNLRLGG
ncbi:MAG TPA: hypothetical protein VFJ85_05600 [Acidimicrobiales bacterium]|nr:hypothetical protein [Acidimicrobiales bacterium]